MNNRFCGQHYLRTRSFKDVQQLFQDKVSPTKMTICKNVKKYKTERSSLFQNKDLNFNLLRENLIENPRITNSPKELFGH